MIQYMAQAVSTGVETSLLSQGITGAFLLIALGVIIFLYKDNKALQAKINELNEKRVEEAEKHASEVVPLFNKLTEQTDFVYKQAVVNSEKRGN